MAAREENVWDEEFMSNAYYYAPNDPKIGVKKFWKDIIEINREKVDKLMTVTNGTQKGFNHHNKLYKSDPLGSKSGKVGHKYNLMLQFIA